MTKNQLIKLVVKKEEIIQQNIGVNKEMEEKRNKKIVHVGYLFASPIRVEFEKARH